MLYEIKFLKAPWPEGAKVGDVVDMPYLPVWAVGKCNIALDGAAATIEFPEPVAADGVNRPLEGNGTGQALPTVEAINAEIAGLREKLAAADQAKDDLQMQLQGTNEAFNEMSAARAAAEKDAADLREKPAAAEAAAVDAAANSATTGAKKR